MMTDLSHYYKALASAREAGTLPSLQDFITFVDGKKPTTEGVTKTQPSLIIPTLTPFIVPKNASIDTLKIDLPISKFCQADLTEENFGMPLPLGGIQGGFISMGRNYRSEEGVAKIKALVYQTGRKFRLGTPLEVLLYKAQNLSHPTYFVSLAKVWNGSVLHWSEWASDGEFDFPAWEGSWDALCEIFVVEDL